MPKVVFLWSSPRSVSTALLRAFQQRQDTSAFHEPYNDCYYFGETRLSTRYGDHVSASNADPDEVGRSIFSCASDIVFVKEMAFLARPFISREMLARSTNTFIVRDPLKTMNSFRSIKPQFTEDEYGYLALWDVWRRVTEDLGQTPVVVDGDELREDPQRVLQLYCESVGIGFDHAMLRWARGDVRQWKPYEETSHARWHSTLRNSEGFIPPRQTTINSSEWSREERQMVARATPLFESMRQHSITNADAALLRQ